MQVILIGHRQDVGKDTFAGYVQTILRERTQSKKVVITGFATDLKRTAHLHYGWAGVREEAYYYPDRKKELAVNLPLLGMTPRDVYIMLGHKLREIHPDFPYLAATHNHRQHGVDYLIIKDFRYTTEAKNDDDIKVRIDNNRIPHFTDGADELLADYTRWDHVVENHGTLKELYKQAEHFVTTFLKV